MIIKNCKLTNTDVTWPERGSDQSYGEPNKLIHTGVDITCTDVYSICSGTVIECSYYNVGYMIVIQYNSEIFLKYIVQCRPEVSCGDVVQSGQHIAKTDKFVHLEYLRTDGGDIGAVVIYRDIALHPNDPIHLFDGSVTFRDYAIDRSKTEPAIDGLYETKVITKLEDIPNSALQEFISMGQNRGE